MAERSIEQMRAERDVLAHAFAQICESCSDDARKIMARVEAIEAEIKKRNDQPQQGGILIGD
ncbi:hypothetical protein [Burkholderia sp. BDU5]|uniref:hypothetical protein n=1 Tax=Burkholderia sp. BDU5 TaxID=1385590 RepID=UPI000755661E|nr:hypothetical protein [Burkholderia sp. BDU5]KVE37333.1 hypothetical protein WS69_11235 [Burkholderia sp. BDU5]